MHLSNHVQVERHYGRCCGDSYVENCQCFHAPKFSTALKTLELDWVALPKLNFFGSTSLRDIRKLGLGKVGFGLAMARNLTSFIFVCTL